MNITSGAGRGRFGLLGVAAMVALLPLMGCQNSQPTTRAEPTVTMAPSQQPSQAPSSSQPTAQGTSEPDESREKFDGRPQQQPGETPTGQTPTSQTPTPSPTSQATTAPAKATQKPPVPGAYPGAGGPAPVGAIQLQPSAPGGIATLKSPTGNIGCELGNEQAGCGVRSLISSGKMGRDDGGPKWWVTLFDSSYTNSPVIGSKGDMPWYDDPSTKPMVVQYGQVVQYGDTVCASQSNGMTCWDVETGHGAFLHAEAIVLF